MSQPSKTELSPDNDPAAQVQPYDRWLSVAVCFFLALAVWFVFGQTRHHDFIDFDDDVYVYENPHVTSGLSWNGIVWAFTHVYHIVWFPLTMISHMADCQLYGLNPGGHHLTNVLLHAVNAILLFLVLRRMTGALWPAAFAAAVFAIHPLRVESVAWVTERKDVLSGLFFMLTLWAYAHYAQQSKIKNQKSKIWYGLSLVFFALGLMSKSMLVTLPFVLLLLDYWPLRRLKPAATAADCWRLALEKIPFLLLAVADSLVTLVTQQAKSQEAHDFSLPWRIGNALLAYADYLGHMIYPVGLALIYPAPGAHLPPGRVALSALVLLLISAGVAAGWRRHPYLLVGWLWYLGMLVPVIDYMQAGDQSRADRYTYLPQIGLYILLAWGAAELCGSWRYRRVVLGSTAAAILVGLLTAAYVQTSYWQDSVTLWTHTLACTSGNSIAHFNLGVALAKQGKWEEALGHYAQALQFNPHYPEAHINLANALARQGKLDEAIQHYEQVLQLNPDYPDAHDNFGIALARQGKLDEAVRHFERAVQLNPDSAAAQNNLGSALTSQGKFAEAIQHFERVLELNPDYASAHDNLGIALARQGKWDEAGRQFQQALSLATAQNNPALADAIRARLKSMQPALTQPQTP